MDLPIKINYYAISTLGEQGTLVAFGLHFISLIKRTRKAQNSHLLPIATPPSFNSFPATFHGPRKNSGNEMKLCSWLRLRWLWLPTGVKLLPQASFNAVAPPRSNYSSKCTRSNSNEKSTVHCAKLGQQIKPFNCNGNEFICMPSLALVMQNINSNNLNI